MNSEVYRSILSAQIQINPAKQMRWRFTAQRDLRTAKAPKKLLKAKKWDILQWPSQSPDFNPREYDFQLLETNLKAERLRNQQQLKVAAVMGLADHLRGETKHLVMSMTVIDSIIWHYGNRFYDTLCLSSYFWASERDGTIDKKVCNSVHAVPFLNTFATINDIFQQLFSCHFLPQ